MEKKILIVFDDSERADSFLRIMLDPELEDVQVTQEETDGLTTLYVRSGVKDENI